MKNNQCLYVSRPSDHVKIPSVMFLFWLPNRFYLGIIYSSAQKRTWLIYYICSSIKSKWADQLRIHCLKLPSRTDSRSSSFSLEKKICLGVNQSSNTGPFLPNITWALKGQLHNHQGSWGSGQPNRRATNLFASHTKPNKTKQAVTKPSQQANQEASQHHPRVWASPSACNKAKWFYQIKGIDTLCQQRLANYESGPQRPACNRHGVVRAQDRERYDSFRRRVAVYETDAYAMSIHGSLDQTASRYNLLTGG